MRGARCHNRHIAPRERSSTVLDLGANAASAVVGRWGGGDHPKGLLTLSCRCRYDRYKREGYCFDLTPVRRRVEGTT